MKHLEGLDWQEVCGWPHLHPSCGRGGGQDIGRMDGSGIPGGRVSKGRVAVWEVKACIVDIVAEGGRDDDGLGSAVVGGAAVEVPALDLFLGVLTCQQARCLPMTMRASPTSQLEPLAVTTCAPETACG